MIANLIKYVNIFDIIEFLLVKLSKLYDIYIDILLILSYNKTLR